MKRILKPTAVARTTPERRVETHGDMRFHFAVGDWDDAMLWLHEVVAKSHSPICRIELKELRAHLEQG